MNIIAKIKKAAQTFEELPPHKQLVIVGVGMLILCLILVYFVKNPIVTDIGCDETYHYRIDGSRFQKYEGYSFHEDEYGTYYTTYGCPPFGVEVCYFFGLLRENLVDAFDEGHITLDDLDRLGFEYFVIPYND